MSGPGPDDRHAEDAVSVEIGGAVGQFAAAEWDALTDGGNPFVSHAFLTALEDSGSVGGRSGWDPLPLAIRDGGQGGGYPVPMEAMYAAAAVAPPPVVQVAAPAPPSIRPGTNRTRVSVQVDFALKAT